MTREEKDTFLETLKSIKPPDEYSSNISRCVQVKERKLIGMKSYDCRMDLVTLKSYVSNKAYPEGSIAEGNDDDGGDNQNEIEESRSGLSSLKRKRIPKYEIDDQSLKQAYRYVLFNVNSLTPFLEEHKSIIKGQNRSRRPSEYELKKIHCQKFSYTLRRTKGSKNNRRNLASSSCTLDIPNLDRVGVDADEVVDGTLIIESKEEVGEEEDEVD
nr:hypothetical protein [Tanacetum cinerariifolium]